MHFEGRELKSYAEPVEFSELKKGSVYFFLNFYDDSMKIPDWETVVLTRKGSNNGKKGKIKFQNAVSYFKPSLPGKIIAKYPRNLYECTPDQLSIVFEFEKAVNGLIGCLLRRKGQRDLFFEGRDLNPGKDPIQVENLKEGKVYYWVVFIDEQKTIPTMTTMHFAGIDLDGGEDGIFYFQNSDTWKKGVPFETSRKEDFSIFYLFTNTQLENIFEFEQALDEILRCSVRRKSLGQK